MFGSVFYWVINMSITSVLVGSVVVLLRLIKKIPRRVIFCLWAIPFLRMVIPIGIGSRYGLIPLISKYAARTIILYGSPDTVDFTMTNCIMAADSYFPITYRTDALEKIFNTAGLIWVIIASALIISFIMLYITSIRALKDSEHFKDNIYFSEKIDTPTVYGIFHPHIIFPVSYKQRDISLVLMHEKVHIKRIDNLWRATAFIIAAIHWFNPFSWMYLKLFITDMEFSCDEKVLAKCGEEKKKKYAGMLIDCIESRNAFVSSFGGAKIYVRIKNILSYKRMSVFSAVCFILLIVAVAFILLTNPQ